MDFDWDEAKSASNRAKHRVSFRDAVQVFDDVRAVIASASRSADLELRFKATGLIAGKLFTVVYTERGKTTRIISARRANKPEERLYGNRPLHTPSP